MINVQNLEYNEKVTKIDSVLQEHRENNNTNKKEIQSYITWLQNKKHYKKVINVTAIEIKEQEKKNPIDSVYTQNLYYHLGLSKYQLKQYDASISFFQSGLQLVNNNSVAGDLYFNLGKCYYRKGDFYQSIKYYKLAQSLFLKYTNLDQLFKCYVNITAPYDNLKTKDAYLKSRAYFFKADSLTPFTSIGKKYSYVVKMGLGSSYNTHETLNVPKASIYYKEALALTKKNKDSFHTGIIYSRLGNLHDTTNPNLGIKYQTKRITYLSKNDSLPYAIAYNNIASCYNTNMFYDQSIANYIKAINYLIANSNENWIHSLKKKLKQKLLNKKNLLKNLKDLADSFLKNYKVNGSKKSLNESLNTFLLTDQLIDLMLIESQEKQSKLFWREQSAELYGKAIEACFLANDAEKAFYFIEKNKALLLTQDLKKQQLKQALNLPDSLVNLEIELKKAVFNLQHIETNSTDKDSITIELLSKERELQQLQDSILKNFSNYKAINTKTTVVSLKDLQNSLDNNTAVLTYNISQYDDYSLITPENGYTPVIPDCKYGVKTMHPAYGMLITKDQVDFFELKNANILKNKVQNLISMMRSPFKTENTIQSYNKNAFELYNTLLPKAFQDKIKNKKLRIIPDNYLHYLPFEALITSNNNYWIQENEISYAYSNSFLQNLHAQEKSKTTSFIGFAPVNYSSANLNPLQNSLEEINQVANYFSGTTYTHKKSTKAQFLKTLPKHDIIHLATHADAQDSISSWIAFTNEKLLQEELSLTTNSAQMVVLSGCNTLLGKQEIGEGVMSLARGFFHSGAQSVISSLWSIDDRSTTEIMSGFYQNLSLGKSKSKALQNAKLNYINNHSLSEASPYYWASFVVLGNTNPLLNSSFNIWWLLLLPFSLILLFLLKKLYSSNSNTPKK